MYISKCFRRAVLLGALLATPGLYAAEVAGMKVEDSLRVGSSDLVLTGAGLRSKLQAFRKAQAEKVMAMKLPEV